ncbi:MAG: histone-fold protein [Planctomycetota bacterium]
MTGGAAPGAPSFEEGGGEEKDGEKPGGIVEFREQDRLLPIANIARIMKQKLPANAKISKEAKETVQECVSEFISFVTSEASDKCRNDKRKTVNGGDVLFAMKTLGFEQYCEVLELYLTKYRDVNKLDAPAADTGPRPEKRLKLASPQDD